MAMTADAIAAEVAAATTADDRRVIISRRPRSRPRQRHRSLMRLPHDHLG
jgi:hypothetical protein